MSRLALVIALSCALAGADVVFFDDFDDGDADGWTELPGSISYQVVDGWYSFAGSEAEEATGASLNGDTGGAMSIQDYSTRARVVATEGNPCLLARFSPFTFTGYAFVCSIDYDMAVIARIDGMSSDPVALDYTYFPLSQGQEYWIRFEVSGDMLGARIWTGSAEDEPSDWLLTAEDQTCTQPGTMGLVALDENPGGTAEVECMFDEVEVTDNPSVALHMETWASIKSCF